MATSGYEHVEKCRTSPFSFNLSVKQLPIVTFVASVQSKGPQTVTVTTKKGDEVIEVFKASANRPNGDYYLVKTEHISGDKLGDGKFTVTFNGKPGLAVARGKAIVEVKDQLTMTHQSVIIGKNDGGCGHDHDYNDMVLQVLAMKKG